MHDEALIGTWLLQSHQTENRETGERTNAFGAVPAGVLIILAAGRMSALITPGKVVAAGPAAGPAPLVAYSGHFRVPSPGRSVTSVDIASIAPWIGTEQERYYAIDGEQLHLSTAPAQVPGDGANAPTLVGHMVWVRETSAVASGGASD